MFTLNGENACFIAPPGAVLIPAEYLAEVRRGVGIVENRVVGEARCDSIFRSLPNGRTFSDLVNSGITIHYDPSNLEGDWGWTIPGRFPNDVVISRYCIRMGRWSIAGTLVHEVAHLNGADGNSHAAENTLQSCRLQSDKGPYNPAIRG